MTNKETTPDPSAASGSTGDAVAGAPAEPSGPGAGPAPAASGATAPQEPAGPAADEAATPEAPAASGPFPEVPASGATVPEGGEGAAPAPAGELPDGDVSPELDPATSPESAVPAEESAGAAGSGGLTVERIQLVSESERSLTVGVRTVLGKHMVRQLGEDFNVWDTEQCVLERTADGIWQIVPREGTTNETMVNGEAVTEPRPLHEGDVIAVGRAAKGVARMPLTVRSA